jgi:hypothetical protein
VKSVKSHTVTVEMEGVLLVPLGSKMTLPGVEVEEELPVPLDEKVLLELETDPIVLAVPIG